MSIAVAVCNGLGSRGKDTDTDKDMDTDTSVGPAGMIVQGDTGGGKTLLLQTILRHFGHENCVYVRCKHLAGRDSRCELSDERVCLSPARTTCEMRLQSIR